MTAFHVSNLDFGHDDCDCGEAGVITEPEGADDEAQKST